MRLSPDSSFASLQPPARRGFHALALALVFGAGGASGLLGQVVGPPLPAKLPEVKRPAAPAQPLTPSPAPQQPGRPGGSFAPVLPPADYKPAVLVLNEEKFDFGTVFKGDEITRTFEMRNDGGSELIVQKIQPGCGCTNVRHDSTVAPGAKGSFTLKINTTNLPSGKISKYADVYTNDPSNAKKRVFIEGTLQTAFNVTPPTPRITLVKGEGQESLDITLERALDTPAKITGVKAANNKVRTELVEKEAAKSYVLKVTANEEGDQKSTYFSDRLTIDVELQGRKLSQDIPVTIQLKSRIAVTPPRTIYFRRPEVQALSSGTAPVTKEILVKSESKKPDHRFSITKVEINEPKFEAKVETVNEGREYKISVQLKSLPEDATVKSLKGDMKIHTDDPSEPVIEMRILAFL